MHDLRFIDKNFKGLNNLAHLSDLDIANQSEIRPIGEIAKKQASLLMHSNNMDIIKLKLILIRLSLKKIKVKWY